MPVVRCPDCGAVTELLVGTTSGDLVVCPNCAGHALRVQQDRGVWTATLAHHVSCPSCDELMPLPEDAKAGDTVKCCGQSYRLTFEYGAFAAEPL